MLEKYSLFNESEMRQWDDFVKSHPQGSPFHLSGWIKTIHETYSFEPFLYVLKNKSGNLSGVFPLFFIRSVFTGNRVVSLPFSDYCGLLCGNEEEENDFLERIIKERKNGIRYVEIRGVLSKDCGFIEYNYYKRHVLQLFADPTKVLKKVDKRTIQYSIRKAKRSGVEIREENNQWGMEEFSRLNKLTRMKHGVPSQPVKFFKGLLNNVILGGNARILLALYDQKAVAAGLFLNCKETVYYKYNASDPDYLTKVTPNHLLTWHAIEMACLQGYRFFDFGRTSPDNEGLMRYKEMWGAQPMDLRYYYFPEIRGAASTEEKGLPYRILTKIWGSLPEAIVEVIGPKIYKHTA